MRLLNTFVALCISAVTVEAMVISGSFNNAGNWVFVNKFCYDNDGLGTLTYYIEGSSSTMAFALYDDVKQEWGGVYNAPASQTCQQKLSFAESVIPVVMNQSTVINFSDHIRPYYWYIALADCSGTVTIPYYNMTMLNPGGSWTRQFSFDKIGLPGAFLFFFLLYSVMVAVQMNAVMVYRQTHGRLHHVVQLFTFSLVLELAGIVCIFLNYVVYASNGIGASGIGAFGEVLDMISQCCFLLLLLLLAKGWTISTATLTHVKPMMAGFAAFVAAYLALFIWQHVGMNPESTNYVYDSTPGVIIVLLRLGLTAWFFYSLRQTIRIETQRDKLKFYIYFGIVFGLYLFSLPLLMLIALAIPSYIRFKIVVSFLKAFETIGFGVMGFLLYPSRAARMFGVPLPDIITSEQQTLYDTL